MNETLSIDPLEYDCCNMYKIEGWDMRFVRSFWNIGHLDLMHSYYGFLVHLNAQISSI